MKILLQSFETGCYLTALGAWTADLIEAMEFSSVLQATEFQITRRVAEAFVVVTSEHSAPPKAQTSPCLLKRNPARRASRTTAGFARGPHRLSDAEERRSPTPNRVPRPLQVHRPVEPLTVIEAWADINPGMQLYIRGEGNGLSWTAGQRLLRGFGNTWLWTSSKVSGIVHFKLLLNDLVWAQGNDMTVAAGSLVQVVPTF